MKNTIIFMVLFLFVGCCRNSDDNRDFRKTLPEATQTGEVMFACYVNGEAFVARGFREVTSFYQWSNGAYHFTIVGEGKGEKPIRSVVLGASYLPIEQGGVYELSKAERGSYWAGANFPYEDVFSKYSRTNEEYTGTLTITHFDLKKEQVAGTFWFDLKNPLTGERVEIREGRFDTIFSQ